MQKEETRMKIAAVIAEYNPLHNGHQYQLKQIKAHYGYDYIIVIMSGDFTQRGTPAILNKYDRTRMALSCGADLVLELPACYAAASAEFFATGAVSILHNLGCIDALFFGSESGNLELLKKAAFLLSEEPPAFKNALNQALRIGKSYATARLCGLEATGSFTKDELSLLSMPNDILGLEYCKALFRLNSSIEPVIIRRIGTGYHDPDISGDIASAEAIRNLIFIGTQGTSSAPYPSQILKLLPSEVHTYFNNPEYARNYLCMDDFSAQLHYQLLMQEDHLSDYQDCTEDIANRIKAILPSYTSASAFLQLLKTKELAYTRLNRVLTHILLGITKHDMYAYTHNEYLGYARILGFTERCKGTLLTILKNNAVNVLITKPADFKPEDSLASMFRTDILASHIYQSALTKKTGAPIVPELKHSPIILSQS